MPMPVESKHGASAEVVTPEPVVHLANSGPVEVLMLTTDEYGDYLHCYPFKCYISNNVSVRTLFECAEEIFPCCPGGYFLQYRGKILQRRTKLFIPMEDRKPAPIIQVRLIDSRMIWKNKFRSIYEQACNKLGYARGPQNPHQYTNPLGLEITNRPAKGWEIPEAEEVPAAECAAAGWPVPTTQLPSTEVCVLHLWGAGRHLMNIPYSPTHPLNPLLRALSAVYQRGKQHFVLRTTRQLLVGEGGHNCLGGRDTLMNMGMPRGGIVNASYTECKPPNQPPFLHNPTDAWRVLQRHGCRILCDLKGERIRKGLGSMRTHILRVTSTLHTLFDNVKKIFMMEQNLVTIHNNTTPELHIVRRMETEKQKSKSLHKRISKSNRNISSNIWITKIHPKEKFSKVKHKIHDPPKDMVRPPVSERPCRFCHNTGLTHSTIMCNPNNPEVDAFPESKKIRRQISSKRRKSYIPRRRKGHRRDGKTLIKPILTPTGARKFTGKRQSSGKSFVKNKRPTYKRRKRRPVKKKGHTRNLGKVSNRRKNAKSNDVLGEETSSSNHRTASHSEIQSN